MPRKTSHAYATLVYFQYLQRSSGKRMAQDGGAEVMISLTDCLNKRIDFEIRCTKHQHSLIYIGKTDPAGGLHILIDDF